MTSHSIAKISERIRARKMWEMENENAALRTKVAELEAENAHTATGKGRQKRVARAYGAVRRRRLGVRAASAPIDAPGSRARSARRLVVACSLSLCAGPARLYLVG